uniref:EOG090X0G12 n=1 Tax=Ceriodaphnia reticulata TaxID=302197 RepID=A0A4Y7LUK7_9CRUS|nr:EOG090X0G12 [Ceriodaphnia reticulata]
MELGTKPCVVDSSDYSCIILPLDNEHIKHFDCLLTLDEKDYALHLHLPNYPLHHRSSVNMSWELRMILLKNDKYKFDHKIIQTCSSISEFIDKLVFLIKECQQINPLSETKKNMEIADYSNIVDEIETIGWEKLLSVNHNFTEIRLKMYDSVSRQHVLNVKFTKSVPEFSAEYPRNINYEWREGSTLKEMYTVFCQAAEQYQEFWEVMEELDSGCWVLEPENPSRRDTYRKISIAPNVSLKVDIDPSHPRLFPSITWLGSEVAVFNFRERILDRIEVLCVWESDLPIHTNLERLLEISLPLKQTFQQDNENHEVTCIICYSERLNGEVPSRTCDNPQCGQSFHIYCLYEWLRGLQQTTRKLGNKVFGTCPFCEQPISCKPPDNPT